MNQGYDIARVALQIGAVKLNPDEPFQWASGYMMPIYNDNRKHLRFLANRNMITNRLYDRINHQAWPEIISGTSTAGIAPAASLAQAANLPLGIIEDGKIRVFSPGDLASMIEDLNDYFDDCDIVVSTCPYGIIPGVMVANERDLPFAYVRSKKKGHGLMQQIEGTINEGEKVVLLDFYNGESYGERAEEAVKEAGGVIQHTISQNIAWLCGNTDVKGERVLHVEDLVSTGGSCINEIETWKEAGADLDTCLAIFSYGFPETLKNFEKAGVELRAALDYETLLEVALKIAYITPEQQEMLAGWSADPFGWGEQHGFPKVEK